MHPITYITVSQTTLAIPVPNMIRSSMKGYG